MAIPPAVGQAHPMLRDGSLLDVHRLHAASEGSSHTLIDVTPLNVVAVPMPVGPPHLMVRPSDLPDVQRLPPVLLCQKVAHLQGHAAKTL